MTSNITENRLLTRKEAATILGVSEMTLAIWKSTNRYQVPCIKVGRLAKYRQSDLQQFIKRRMVNQPEDWEKHE